MYEQLQLIIFYKLRAYLTLTSEFGFLWAIVLLTYKYIA